MDSYTVFTFVTMVMLVGGMVSGEPIPVMSFPESGVYSLFPNEDLRTGKAIRPLRERIQEQFPRSRTHNTFLSRRGNRVIFDDDRLNFRGHFDQADHFPPTPSSSLERTIYSSRDERYDLFIPAVRQSRLPPIAQEPTRIHIFSPEDSEPQPPPSISLGIESDEDIGESGRLLLPVRHNFIDIRDLGSSSFLNHDEYLNYHLRGAFGSLEEKERVHNHPTKCNEESKRLLFSAHIPGLVPPSTSTEISSSTSTSTESIEPERTFNGKIPVTSSVTIPRVEHVKRPVLEGGFIPISISPPPYAEEEISRPTARTTIHASSGTEVPPTPSPNEFIKTASTKNPNKERSQYPYVKKSRFQPGQIIRIVQKPGTRRRLPTVSTTPVPDYNGEDSEITFPPNTFDDFVGRRGSSAFAATKIRTEIPLIFLDSHQEVDSGEKNAIFIKRVKNPSRNKTYIESHMTVHSSSLDSAGEEAQRRIVDSEEITGGQSVWSSKGIVSKVHAHVSHCPKLHGAVEIICDVHIRKRHGSRNPQLIVGWKKKFQNATKEDVLLAINTTLAYIEEDFHDKFNVTLAPGISPMLRSVLRISEVDPSDTGNYECQVEDEGKNKLRSDTLLFLCH